eukprot:scaffold68136_cov55-Phaeocystis_antarctica.AAC.2
MSPEEKPCARTSSFSIGVIMWRDVTFPSPSAAFGLFSPDMSRSKADSAAFDDAPPEITSFDRAAAALSSDNARGGSSLPSLETVGSGRLFLESQAVHLADLQAASSRRPPRSNRVGCSSRRPLGRR